MNFKPHFFIAAFALFSTGAFAVELNFGTSVTAKKSKVTSFSVEVPVDTSRIDEIAVNWYATAGISHHSATSTGEANITNTSSITLQTPTTTISQDVTVNYVIPTKIYQEANYVNIGVGSSMYLFNQKILETIIEANYNFKQSDRTSYSVIKADKEDDFTPANGLNLAIGARYRVNGENQDTKKNVEFTVQAIKNIHNGSTRLIFYVGKKM
jgi:hypothetical protein